MPVETTEEPIALDGGCEIKATAKSVAGTTAVPVTIEAYGGGVLDVPRRGPTVIDLQGLATPGSVPLLTDHKNAIAAQAGQGTPHTNGRTLSLVGGLASETAAGSEVMAGHRGGSKYQASVGVTPLKTERIMAGRSVEVNGQRFTAGPEGLQVVRRSRLNEVTITPLGLDRTTSVSIAASKELEGVKMSEQTEIQAVDTNDGEYLLALGRAVGELRASNPDRAELIEIKARAEGWSIEKVEAQVENAKLRTGLPTSPIAAMSGSNGSPRGNSRSVVSSQEFYEAAITAAAYGEDDVEAIYGARMAEEVRDLVGADVGEITATACRHAGLTPTGRRDELFGQAMNPSGIQAGGGGVSYLNAPVAMGNSATKALRQMYAEATSPWRKICFKDSVHTFHEYERVQPKAPGEFLELGHGAAIKAGKGITESVYKVQVNTFSTMDRFTRQQEKNDMLGILREMRRMIGQKWIRSLNNTFTRTLLATGSPFFSTKNSRSGAGTALSIDSLTEAITMLRKQVDADGNPIDVTPTTLLVPPELEHSAKTHLESSYVERIATGSDIDELRPTGNPIKSSLNYEVDPRLSNENFNSNSATGWYIFGPPASRPLTAIFLDGKETPVIEIVPPDDQHLASSWKAYGEFAFQAVDSTAAVRFAGA